MAIGKVRGTVERAGFQYRSAEVVARGKLLHSSQSGSRELILEDSKASMEIRLMSSDTESVRESHHALADRDSGDTVQVRGPVLDSKQARRKAESHGAQFSLTVTDWAPSKSAKLPPLVPDESEKSTKEDPESNAAWF